VVAIMLPVMALVVVDKVLLPAILLVEEPPVVTHGRSKGVI
jgi:hypothetical protein